MTLSAIAMTSALGVADAKIGRVGELFFKLPVRTSADKPKITAHWRAAV